MLARTATVAASALASLALASPATALPVGVNTCDIEAPADTTLTCVFYGNAGYFSIDLTTRARYSWAEASCTGGGSLYVNAWDYEYHDWVDGSLGGGVCTMSVSAGSGGVAWAIVQRY